MSLSIALQDARSSDPLRQCRVRWAPGKAAGPCAPGPHVRPTARVRGAAPAAALPSFAGGGGIVNALCPPRHLEPWPLVCGQAAPMRGQIVVPGLSRSIARRLSKVTVITTRDTCPLSRNCSPCVARQYWWKRQATSHRFRAHSVENGAFSSGASQSL